MPTAGSFSDGELGFTYSKHGPNLRNTLTFQALRMVVNDEVEELNKVLSDSFSLLGIGGRLAVISYHSTEDKIDPMAENRYPNFKLDPTPKNRSRFEK